MQATFEKRSALSEYPLLALEALRSGEASSLDFSLEELFMVAEDLAALSGNQEGKKFILDLISNDKRSSDIEYLRIDVADADDFRREGDAASSLKKLSDMFPTGNLLADSERLLALAKANFALFHESKFEQKREFLSSASHMIGVVLSEADKERSVPSRRRLHYLETSIDIHISEIFDRSDDRLEVVNLEFKKHREILENASDLKQAYRLRCEAQHNYLRGIFAESQQRFSDAMSHFSDAYVLANPEDTHKRSVIAIRCLASAIRASVEAPRSLELKSLIGTGKSFIAPILNKSQRLRLAEQISLIRSSSKALIRHGDGKNDYLKKSNPEVIRVEPEVVLNNRVKELRMARGWRQEDLAHKAGVDTETVSRAEKGIVGVSAGTKRKILNAFGLPLESASQVFMKLS